MKKRNVYNEHTLKSIRHDRSMGLTIPELVIKYKIPKTTIWHHVHTVVLPEDTKKEILSRRGGSKKRRIQREQEAMVYARNILCSNIRELAIASTMLYWAEGHKNSFVFTNTDVQMHRIFISFMDKAFDIQKGDYMALLRVSDPIAPDEAVTYWSQSLNLPVSVFKINHDNIQNRTKSQYGICRLTVRKNNYYHKVIQSLQKIIKEEFAPVV